MLDRFIAGMVLDISPDTINYQVEVSINLLEDLKAPLDEVRAHAVMKLKQISYNLREHLDKKVITGLVKALKKVDDELKIDIIIALGFTREAKVLPILRKFLLESEDFEIKRAAAFAIGEMKFRGPVSALIEALKFDDEQLHLFIIDALSKINDKNCAANLIEACKPLSQKVKFAACGLMCKFNFKEGYDFIKKALTHNSDEIKKEALKIAIEHPSDKFIEPVFKLLVDNKTPEIILMCIDALAQTGNESAASYISPFLKNSDPLIRAATIDAFSRLNVSQYSGEIIECLKDCDETVRANAATALGTFKLVSVMPALIEITDDQSEKVRIAVCTSIRTLAFWISDITDKNRVTYALMALLKDKCETVRSIAIETLGYLANPESIDALIEAVNDDSLQVRQNTAAALGNFEDTRISPILINMLDDQNVVIKWNAITSLTKLNEKNALSKIKELTNDPDETIRLAAQSFLDNFLVH